MKEKEDSRALCSKYYLFVFYTDVYNPHILAGIVFASDQGYGNIKKATFRFRYKKGNNVTLTSE